MTKKPNIRHITLLIAAGLMASLLARPGLAADLDELGRVPYQFFTISAPCVAATPTTSASCSAATPPVPAGKRLVIQHASFNLGGGAGATFYKLTVAVNAAAPGGRPVSFSGGAALGGGGNISVDLPVLGYADAGSTVVVLCEHDAPITVGKTAIVVVSGSLVDCSSANPCAPIAL